MSSSVASEQPFALEAQRLANAFTAARRNATALATFPGAVPQTLEEAYQCQEAAIGVWPDPVAGWKVARVGTTWQAAFATERLIGPAFRPNIHVLAGDEIPECPVFAGGFAAVEAEVVIVVGTDAPAAKTDWSIDEVKPLIASMHVGIEVASSPLSTLNDLGPGAVIADFGNNWGIVVGAAIPRWRELREIAVESFIEDISVGSAKVNIVNGPLSALVFTLEHAAARGRPLRSGDVITTGMITGVHDIAIGQRSRHVFDGCGEVRCRIVRATSYASIT